MPRSANVEETRRDFSFFEGMDPVHKRRLKTLGREVRFDRDEVIFREGEESNSFYIILSGRVSLEVTALGRTLRVITLDDGDGFGWSSLLPSQGKQFQARALDPVHALLFDGAALGGMCERDPAFGYEIMKRLLILLSDRLQALRIQLFDMYSPTGGR
jgi:CRP/FNR family transcriptional regulator, cyclic AMP receptor protein